jgi:hypothetical protein
MLIAGEVITAARDRSPDFDPRRHPDPAVLRHLSGYQRQLMAKAVQVNRLALALTADFAIPEDDDAFGEGLVLPDYQQLHAVTVTSADDRVYHVEIIPYGQRDMAHRFDRVAWTLGTRLYLGGEYAQWRNAAGLFVLYTPAAEPLETLEDEFVLPDSAHDALVEEAAAFLARRAHHRDYAIARTVADRARADWLDSLGFQRARRFYTRPG